MTARPATRTRHLTDAEKAELERMVDVTSLQQVLWELSVIAMAKAEHVQYAWQDSILARQWADCSLVCERAAANPSVQEVSP